MVFKWHITFLREKDVWEVQAFAEEQKQGLGEDGKAMWTSILLDTKAGLCRRLETEGPSLLLKDWRCYKRQKRCCYNTVEGSTLFQGRLLWLCTGTCQEGQRQIQIANFQGPHRKQTNKMRTESIASTSVPFWQSYLPNSVQRITKRHRA